MSALGELGTGTVQRDRVIETFAGVTSALDALCGQLRRQWNFRGVFLTEAAAAAMQPAPAAYDVWFVLPTQFLYVQLTVKDQRRRARIGFTLENA